MLEFESKEQPATKFWVSDTGYLCIRQESLEFERDVTHTLGPDAVELLAKNIVKFREEQKTLWNAS